MTPKTATAQTSVSQINPQLAAMQAQIDALMAENAKLKTRAESKLHIKMSAKGAISVYGLGRFPVTLYASQWERLFGIADSLKAFAVEHASELATKEKAETAKTASF